MNYEEAIQFVHSTNKFGSKLGLQNITKLTELLGNPQDSYKIIHVAGTNGKGSISNMIHNVLFASEYKTGLFTSPYLEKFTEMIQVNKQPIDKESFANITSIIKDKIDIIIEDGYSHPTEFEIMVAIGLKYFQEQKIDFLVLEVGLGGRIDATNIVKNTLVSVITSISYDHMEFLGNTLEKIAYEKAGIIKKDSNVVIYPQEETITNVIKTVAREKKATVYETDKKKIKKLKCDLTGQWFKYNKTDVFNLPDVKISLLGEHQLNNALTALRTLEVIKEAGYEITNNSILEGLKNCRFAGRFEILNTKPAIIIDGGHNIDGIEHFSKAVKQYFKDKKIVLFFGMLKDKNPEAILPYIIPICNKVYTLTPNNPRAMKSEELAELFKKHSDLEVTPINDYNEIISILNNTDKNNIVAFVGSLYMIGYVRKLILENLMNLNN